MKKRIAITLCLLGLVVGFDALAMSDADKKKYLKLVKQYFGEAILALAVDADGRWAYNGAQSPPAAKTKALALCKEHSKKPETCKIVDVDGKSDFVKNKSSSTTSTATPYVWCAGFKASESDSGTRILSGERVMHTATLRL